MDEARELRSGTVWSVERSGDRVLVEHGAVVEDGAIEWRGRVFVSLGPALELAVGIVQACLQIDEREAQARMLALYAETLVERR